MTHPASGTAAQWPTLRLGEIADTQLGKTINPRTKGGPRQRPYLRNANVRWGSFDLSDVATMHFSEAESTTFDLKSGDLLVCEGGMVGRAAIWDNAIDNCHFQNALHRVRPKNGGISSDWLLENLRWLSITGQLAEAAQGVTIQHLSQKQLRELPIFMPPRELQDSFVGRLVLVRGLADSANVNLNIARRALNDFRQSVLESACTGQLTDDWRRIHGWEVDGLQLLRDVIAERKARLSSTRARVRSGTTELARRATPFDIPDTWSWAIWDDLADWITYGFTRPMPHVERGIPIVTAKNIRDGIIDFTGADQTTHEAFVSLSDKDIPRAGEILLTKDGSIGRAAVVPAGQTFCINQSVAIIRFGATVLNPRFLMAMIESPFTQRLIAEAAKGSAIQHIAITAFGRLPVPIAPVEEQNEIARRVDSLFATADEILNRINRSSKAVDLVSGSLLSEAFGADLTNA